MKTVNEIVNNSISGLITALEFVDGRFGRKVLKRPYRSVWRVLTYGSLFLLLWNFIIVSLFRWWDGVVRFLNYVIWG